MAGTMVTDTDAESDAELLLEVALAVLVRVVFPTGNWAVAATVACKSTVLVWPELNDPKLMLVKLLPAALPSTVRVLAM